MLVLGMGDGSETDKRLAGCGLTWTDGIKVLGDVGGGWMDAGMTDLGAATGFKTMPVCLTAGFFIAASSLAKTAALSNWPAAMASSSRHNNPSTARFSSLAGPAN